MLERFGKGEENECCVDRSQTGGEPERGGGAEPRRRIEEAIEADVRGTETTADIRAKNETEAEGGADKAKVFRSVFVGRHVANGRLGDGEISPGDAVEGTTGKEQRNVLGGDADGEDHVSE